jgi:hypothetical protein
MMDGMDELSPSLATSSRGCICTHMSITFRVQGGLGDWETGRLGDWKTGGLQVTIKQAGRSDANTMYADGLPSDACSDPIRSVVRWSISVACVCVCVCGRVLTSFCSVCLAGAAAVRHTPHR